MLKFALIDDDKKLLIDFYKMLKSIFIKHDLDAKVVFYSTNVVALLDYVKDSKVDVLFLDIDLKSNLSGLEIAEIVRKSNRDCYIIFETAHLEYGLTYLKEMNAQMYCAILHEHEHMGQFDDIDSEKNDETTEIFRKNIANMLPYDDKTVSGYVEYRFQPIEYYAHKISEEGTIKAFKRLEQDFGKDQGFETWFDAISSASIDNLVELYNEEYACNFSFDEIYQNVVKKISEFSKKRK